MRIWSGSSQLVVWVSEPYPLYWATRYLTCYYAGSGYPSALEKSEREKLMCMALPDRAGIGAWELCKNQG